MTAARTGNVDAIKLLVAHGANANGRDARGQTALMWAAARNNADAVKLLRRGRRRHQRAHQQQCRRAAAASRMSVFNAPGADRLHRRCSSRCAPAASPRRAPCSMPAPTSTITLSDGESALVVATANAHWELAELLLDRGANPNAPARAGTRLHQTVHSRRPNLGYTPGPVSTGNVDSIDVVKKLIAQGRRRQRADDEERHEGRAAQPRQPARRDGVLPRREEHRLRGDEGPRRRRRRRDDPERRRHDAADGRGGAAHAGTSARTPARCRDRKTRSSKRSSCASSSGNDVNAVNLVGETPMHGAAFRGVNTVVEYPRLEGARTSMPRTNAAGRRDRSPTASPTATSSSSSRRPPSSSRHSSKRAAGLSTEGRPPTAPSASTASRRTRIRRRPRSSATGRWKPSSRRPKRSVWRQSSRPIAAFLLHEGTMNTRITKPFKVSWASCFFVAS